MAKGCSSRWRVWRRWTQYWRLRRWRLGGKGTFRSEQHLLSQAPRIIQVGTSGERRAAVWSSIRPNALGFGQQVTLHPSLLEHELSCRSPATSHSSSSTAASSASTSPRPTFQRSSSAPSPPRACTSTPSASTPSSPTLSHLTFPFALKAAFRLPNSLLAGVQLHTRSLKLPSHSNPHVLTSLLNLHAKCGLLHDAQRVFDEMSQLQLHSALHH